MRDTLRRVVSPFSHGKKRAMLPMVGIVLLYMPGIPTLVYMHPVHPRVHPADYPPHGRRVYTEHASNSRPTVERVLAELTVSDA